MTPLFRARTAAWHSTSGLSGVMAATAPCSGRNSLDKGDWWLFLHPLHHAMRFDAGTNCWLGQKHKTGHANDLMSLHDESERGPISPLPCLSAAIAATVRSSQGCR